MNAGQPDQRGAGAAAQVTRIAAATTGIITGLVLDERGQPLADVVVSAVGGSTSFAVSDRAGQFTLTSLRPGPYLVRAHLEGYVAARQSIVTVLPSARTVSTFTLRRVATDDPRVVAAGAAEVAVPDDGARDESETAWRLRRLKRSILRDSTALAGDLAAADDDWFLVDPLQFLGRAVESSARMAGAFLMHAPFEGQVNLLTTGAFDTPGELLQLDRTRGVAFFSLGAPVGEHGDWTVKAALNQGDLSAWLLAGNYVTRAPAAHRYEFGMSYGVHRYEGGNAVALAAMPETARNVGALYGYDQWRLSDYVTLGYGAHYGHYDYLAQPAHLSPRLGATIKAAERLQIHAVATRRVTAPGAEEFLPPSTAQVLPPQRTFAPLTREGFRPEDTVHYEVAVEQSIERTSIGLRAFRQETTDQLVTVFGMAGPDAQPAEIGHYFVGTAGNVGVHGWGVTVSHDVTSHVRSVFEYSLAEAGWAAVRSLDRGRLARTLPAALRTGTERIHDFTTTLETEFPASATRVYFLYKVNSAYIRETPDGTRAGFDGRWDVQVSQGLPFMRLMNADWEMLVGIRNLFRDSFREASVYDELLVARPPKRLVGGITVKF